MGDFDGNGAYDIFRYLPGTSGAEVFLSIQLMTSPAEIAAAGENPLAFDEDMILEMQGMKGFELTEQEEADFLAPFIQRVRAGEEVSIFEIKAAYEEILGRSVRKVQVNKLLYKHGFWEIVEETVKQKEVIQK
jgi:hypothetical protein